MVIRMNAIAIATGQRLAIVRNILPLVATYRRVAFGSKRVACNFTSISAKNAEQSVNKPLHNLERDTQSTLPVLFSCTTKTFPQKKLA
jgi:hypothetical protein